MSRGSIIQQCFFAVSEKRKSEGSDYEPKLESAQKQLSGIEIHVLNNGNGIPEEIKGKIFQPFFTTKSTGRGTGLRMSLA